MFKYVEAGGDPRESDNLFRKGVLHLPSSRSSQIIFQPQRLAVKGTATVLRGVFLYVSF